MRGVGRTFESLEDRHYLALTISFDYSLDATGFFADQSRRDLMDQAASIYEGRINDTLSALQPSGGNTWTAIFNNPATGADVQLGNQTIAAGTIRVYVGSRDLPGTTLAEGGPGGFNASGSTSWVQLVQARGQAGALQSPATDFGPWGGVITFDPNINWFFGSGTAGLVAGMTDFVTVAMHELGHVLGFGNTVPNNSYSRYVSGTSFTGPNAMAEYDIGGAVPLAASLSHWADGLSDGGLETIMDPSISSGARKLPTPLDFAALADIGWNVASNIAPVLDTSGAPFLTSISEDPISNPGTLVTTILGSVGNGGPISDPDGPQVGIAVTAVNTSGGSWQYSINSGSTWQAFGTPSTSTARLLAADGSTLIRFVPNANFSGTLANGISFRAWDRSTGTNGGVADTTTNGGTTAFSTAIESASLTVVPVADAPSVTPAATLEDTQTTSGLVISRNAADGAEVTHFKIFGVSGGSVFLSNGTTPVVDGSFITAAQATAGLRFTPAQDYVGPAGFMVRAATNSSDSALGGAPATASVSITAVNDAPTFTAGTNLTVQTAAPQTLTGWATNISAGPSDESWQSLSFTLTADAPELFDVQPMFDEDGTLTFTPAAGARGTTTVTVLLTDNGGTADGGVDTSIAHLLTVVIDTAPWQNPVDALDVDQDGEVIPLDALLVINELNDIGAHDLAPPAGPTAPPPFFDVNGDAHVSPLDALLVINFLNGQTGENAVNSSASQATLPRSASMRVASQAAAAPSTSLAVQEDAVATRDDTPARSDVARDLSAAPSAWVKAEHAEFSLLSLTAGSAHPTANAWSPIIERASRGAWFVASNHVPSAPLAALVNSRPKVGSGDAWQSALSHDQAFLEEDLIYHLAMARIASSRR